MLGSTIRFSDEEVPTVTGAVIPRWRTWSAHPARGGRGATGVYVSAIEKAAERIADRPAGRHHRALFAGRAADGRDRDHVRLLR
jgi:hypothetical protein